MKLSIVSTMFFSAQYLQEFHARISATAKRVTDHFEIILVNDGSPDDSLEVALSLLRKDNNVRIVDLSRNFGHHKAIMTGLAQARGELVFLIDCDLEEAPELLLDFLPILEQHECDMVYGVQETRKGNAIERISGDMFYQLFNFLANVPIPLNVITARLMTRRYVESLIAHQEREIFLLGLWTITGYKQVPLIVRKLSKGSSTYNLNRKVQVVINSITSFSNKPLELIFYLGLVISMIAGSGALYLLIRRIFFGEYLSGWPSLIISVWFLGGLIIFCLGILGIYVSKMFSEVKQRPYTIIRHIYEQAKQ